MLRGWSKEGQEVLLAGVWRCSQLPFFTSKTGGVVERISYGNRSVIPTGQWSDPVTSGMMKAPVTEGASLLVTKK